jgi:hypothetical protein
MSVYESHEATLGNKKVIARERELLQERLDDVSEYIKDTMLKQEEHDSRSLLLEQIGSIRLYFDEMLEILAIECGNCREYVFNTINRFIECRTSYSKLLNELRLNQILKECLEATVDSMLIDTSIPVGVPACSSMY